MTLANRGLPVTLLARTAAEAEVLESERKNSRFLPQTPFPASLRVTADARKSVSSAGVVILAVPSDRLRQNVKGIKDFLSDGTTVVSATKGLELPSASRMSQVLENELPPQLSSGVCTLSGPNLAKEIVQGKPASTVVAGRNLASTKRAQNLLMSNRFRVYTSSDLVGVELAGTLKNLSLIHI